MAKEYPLKIEILSYWHTGSGHGAKADADALVLRDGEGFPYVPGRTLKGLIRDALLEMGREDLADELLGREATEGANSGSKPGILAFDDGRMLAEDREWILQSSEADDLKANLFDTISATSMNPNGVAVDHSLRMIEVSLPMHLGASITYFGRPESEIITMESISVACRLIRSLGAYRHRGLGRCNMQFNPPA